jgi:hypothetical protein
MRFLLRRHRDDVIAASPKRHQWHSSRMSFTRLAHDFTLLSVKTFITFFVTKLQRWRFKDVPYDIFHGICYHEMKMMSQCQQCWRVYCDIYHDSLLSRDGTDVTVSLTGRHMWCSPRFLLKKNRHDILHASYIKRKHWHHKNVIDMHLWCVLFITDFNYEMGFNGITLSCPSSDWEIYQVFFKSDLVQNVTKSFRIVIFSVTNRMIKIPYNCHLPDFSD